MVKMENSFRSIYSRVVTLSCNHYVCFESDSMWSEFEKSLKKDLIDVFKTIYGIESYQELFVDLLKNYKCQLKLNSYNKHFDSNLYDEIITLSIDYNQGINDLERMNELWSHLTKVLTLLQKTCLQPSHKKTSRPIF